MEFSSVMHFSNVNHKTKIWLTFGMVHTIPDGAEFAVLSSGTTGTPKLIFRTVNSWYDFFEIQNKVFSICSETVLFIQGSLCFPGNLNMLLGALYAGATIVMSKDILSRKKIAEIEKYKVDTIYMIPDKLRVITKIMQ